MNCDQAKPLLPLYADGELDAARVLELEAHLRSCPTCAPAWQNLQNLKKAVKQDALYFTAPAALKKSLQTELLARVNTQPERSRPERKSSGWNWGWNWNWLTTATSGLAVACLALLLTVTLSRPSAQQELAQEVVSNHIRSLMASHELDVVSTDQHTVKPWFNGKLDFSPPVKDFAAQGFPLIGGRLDYLDGHSAAALIYHRNKHILNLFIWPASVRDAVPAVVTSRQGYNVIHWSQAGMTFWLVSDLNPSELEDFARLFAS